MKKIFALFLALVIVLSLAACGGDNNNPVAGGNTDPTNNTTEMTDAPTESTQATTENATPSNTEPLATNPPSAEPGHTHSYSTTITAPTCNTDGYTTYKCSCGDSYVSDKTQPVGHKYGEWQTTKQPTITETGIAERKCANCSTKETKMLGKVIANHTHNYTSEVTKTASCTNYGTKVFSCVCGESYTETIAKTNHNYAMSVIEPTCTARGCTAYLCGNCGDFYTTAQTAAKGHSWSSWTTEVVAEVGKAGLKRRTCSTCKTSETQSIPALQEDLTKKWFLTQYDIAKQQYINGLDNSVTEKQSQIDNLTEQASVCYVAYVNETKKIKNQCANMGMSNSGYEASLLKNAKDNYNAQVSVYTNKIKQLENEISTVEAEKTSPNVDSILEIVAKNCNISSREAYEHYYKYSDSIS